MNQVAEFPMAKTIVHLLSGGLDSVVMLYDLHAQGHQIYCLLFDYQQKHGPNELECAQRHCARLGVKYEIMRLPQLRGSSLTDGGAGVVVPNRNAIMLSLAVNVAVTAKADTITYACNADDNEHFPDCRPEFVAAMNAAVHAAGYRVEICAPYIDRRKWWIGGTGRELGVDLSDTWSCYRGGEKPCGECPACQKRKDALAA
jgi:7-cyano-7-deazaguanine synthase